MGVHHITKKSQASGEYDIYVDGRFYCTADRYDIDETMKEIEESLKEADKKKVDTE